MLAGSKDKNAVTVYWPHWRQRREKIRSSGRCPSFGIPRRLPNPGGLVALVDGGGRVLLLFQIERIEEDLSIVAANGRRYKHGCVLVARKGTMRLPRERDPKDLPVNRRAPGAFAYFDAKSLELVVYKPGGDPNPVGRAHFPNVQCSFLAPAVGKSLSQPERRLVLAYAKWIGKLTFFIHHKLFETGLYTDLFIPRCWTLIEAKARTHRRTLREAVGQLFDYQRHYDRKPRLAVLLPKKPPSGVMGLFERKRILVVWESGATFRDSADGCLTTDLRAAAKRQKS